MRCICGNDKFIAHQQCYHDVIVTGDNMFIEDVDIYESSTPYGDYTCTKCGREYRELKEGEVPYGLSSLCTD